MPGLLNFTVVVTEISTILSSTPFCFVVRILVTPPRVRPYTLFDVINNDNKINNIIVGQL